METKSSCDQSEGNESMNVDESIEDSSQNIMNRENGRKEHSNFNIEKTKTRENMTTTKMEIKKHKMWKKKKGQKDLNAPKFPLTGYVRFMNDHRDRVRGENPNLSFQHVTKLLASDWAKLGNEEKQRYLMEAEIDKERYTREWQNYKKSDAYKKYYQKTSKKHKESFASLSYQNGVFSSSSINLNKTSELPKLPPPQSQNANFFFEIPIFTEAFLDHYKARECELRQLRRHTCDQEEGNSSLNKQVEELKQQLEQLQDTIQQQKINNTTLQQHLILLKSTLIASLVDVKLPDGSGPPTLSTIDSFMTRVYQVAKENHSSNQDFISLVKGKVLDLKFE